MVDSEARLRLHRTFDSFGNIVDETHYDADGEEVSEGQMGYLDAAFAYTGRLFDQTTGLQNNLNRWYDASIGRWLSEDPIGFSGGDANLYRYVGNGPVNGSDPSGLDPAFPPGIGIGSGFYKKDPVLPIDGAMQEPQYIWVCLGTYGGIGAGTFFAAETYFPTYLYHFTSGTGYSSIMEGE